MNEIFLPYRLVAEFADGKRLTFDGLTEEQARQNMEDAQAQHGDIAWYDGVTDANYDRGKYYKLIPQPPCVNLVDLEGYDGPLDENGLPVGLADEIAKNDPNEKPIIITHTEGDFLSGLVNEIKKDEEENDHGQANEN